MIYIRKLHFCDVVTIMEHMSIQVTSLLATVSVNVHVN